MVSLWPIAAVIVAALAWHRVGQWLASRALNAEWDERLRAYTDELRGQSSKQDERIRALEMKVH